MVVTLVVVVLVGVVLLRRYRRDIGNRSIDVCPQRGPFEGLGQTFDTLVGVVVVAVADADVVVVAVVDAVVELVEETRKRNFVGGALLGKGQVVAAVEE